MASIRDIRRKIQSVGNIQKITQAMELVAASRLRKAQAKLESSRPYTLELKEILDLLILSSEDLKQPLITPRKVKRIGVIVIAGDRGLCGSYNQAIFSAADKLLHKNAAEAAVVPVGKKPVDYFERRKWPILSKLQDWGGKITYPQIAEFTNDLIGRYLQGEVDEVQLVYTQFINMTSRKVMIEKLLPIDVEKKKQQKDDYIIEPDAHRVLAELLPRYTTMKIQTAMHEAYTSELAARISSMRTAAKNAKDMIESLTLTRNKIRQAGITRELIEITSGAESFHG